MNYPEGLRGIYMVIIFPAKKTFSHINVVTKEGIGRPFYTTSDGREILDPFYKKEVNKKDDVTEEEFKYILQEYERYKKFYEAIQSFMQHPYGDYREKEDV